MKLRKIFAAVLATAVAVTALAATAAAAPFNPGEDKFYIPEGQTYPILSTDGNWLVQLYNEGSEKEKKPAVDFGVDVTAVAKMVIVFKPDGDFKDLFEGAWGGSPIFSANGGVIGTSGDLYKKYNWPGFEWWGVCNNGYPTTEETTADGTAGVHDPATGWINTVDLAKTLHTEAHVDGTYSLTFEVPEANRWIADGGCYQIGLQNWGGDLAEYHVTLCAVYDDDDALLIAFDEFGNPITDAATVEGMIAEKIDPEATLLEATGGAAAEETTAADAEATTVAEDTTAAETTEAPAAASNGLSTTTIIIIIVAAVVVIAVIVIIVVVSKKKKN